MVIDGKKIASGILAKLKSRPAPKKFLAVVLVDLTSSPQVGPSLSFIKQKEKVAKELGVDFRLYKFPANPPVGGKNDELRDEVRKIAEHKTCGGVVVQLPLPEHINAQYILNVIPREKDVDVLGERALGAFYANRNPVLPPAVGVVEEILKAKSYNLKASSVAIVGLGPLVGKPVSMWLMRKVKGLHLLRSVSDLSVLKDADLVISGAGKAGLIKPEMLKPGAGVIDFGYSAAQAPSRNDAEQTQNFAEKGGLVGDLDTSSSSLSSLSFYTPTPGGTGPILVAKVFENFYKLNADSKE